MNTYKNTFPAVFNLQLLADGAAGAGDGGTASQGAMGVTGAVAMPQTKGVKSNPLADVKYGIQDEVGEAPASEVQEDSPDLDAEFEELIKGKYKAQYNKRTQHTIQKRLKGTKDTVAKYEALAPTLDMLSKKYGVDASDIDALNKAIEEDDSYYEDEALEKGVTVEQLKEIRRMERENSELRKAMQEQQAKENGQKLYAQWMEQAEATAKVYPSFDLEAEMANPQFQQLLRANIDVRTAYEVLHKDEIIPAAMQFTAKTVEQKLANKIKANGSRPTENGNSAQSASLIKADVSQLTKADRQEIARRVAAGEKIRF